MKITNLKLNDNNPRIIKDEKFKKLVKSIKDFPKMMELRPIVVDKEMVILGGNMRYRALQKAGYLEIPDTWVKIADELTEEEKKRFIIEDNMPFGEWDWDMLANNFEVGDLLEWGFSENELKIEQEVIEDEVPEISSEPAVSKVGEVYQLGRHRLMSGDATKIEEVEKLMDGKKADMVFTDPPYGVGYEYNEHKDIGGQEYEDLVVGYMDIACIISPFVVVTPGKSNEELYFKHFKVIDSAVWFKKFATTRGHCYHAMVTEPILFFGEKPTNKFLDTDILEIMTDREQGLRKGHTCPKPIKLPSEIIKAFTEKEQIVLDIFGGSGSTLIACEQTNRTCYMMELDEKYCDVIRKRYAKFINKEEEWQKITPQI